EGVMAADYANYSIPLDIQDLVAGKDPYKFMDLMKMRIQSAEGDDSSSEDDDQGEVTPAQPDNGTHNSHKEAHQEKDCETNAEISHTTDLGQAGKQDGR
ncbi:hypothetical protein PoB_004973700, partial [Plakobranchus ocellatus]